MTTSNLPNTKYEVVAWLRLKGKFDAQMQAATRSMGPATRRMNALKMSARGMSTSMTAAAAAMLKFGRIAAITIGALATAGFGVLINQGLRFNKTLEDAQLSLSTMFALYDVGKKTLDKNADSGQVFQRNMDLASSATAKLMKLQEKTPAGFKDLLNLYQSGAAGLAKATPNVEKHLELVTNLSMLGPALSNDYGQIGRDTMRIMTGGAGIDVLTWRLLSSEVLNAGKELKLVNKQMELGDAWVKQFNKTGRGGFSATQRMAMVEKAIAKIGPQFREAFANSMTGLLTTMKSKTLVIAKAFTAPLYNGFKEFLKRARSTGGILDSYAVKRWMGIAAYFGKELGGAAEKLYAAFEKGAIYVLFSWNTITDNLLRAFDIGGLLLKAYITKALAIAMLRPIMGMGRGAMSLVKWDRVGDRMGKRIALAFAKRRALAARGAGGLRRVGPLATMGMGFMSLMGVMGPMIPIALALAAAFAVVGVMLAGVAAYITQNWNKLLTTVLKGWGSVAPQMTRIMEKILGIWGALVVLGDAMLGGKNATDKLNFVLDIFETAVDAVASSLAFLALMMRYFNIAIGGVQDTLGKKDAMLAEFWRAAIPEVREGEGGLKAIWAKYAGFWGGHHQTMSSALQESAMENAMDAIDWARVQAAIEGGQTREGRMRNRVEAEEMVDKFKEYLKGLKDKGKVPVGGINIENMYNQWDLRNTDPDRLMSAFIPALEEAVDSRGQAYDQLDQGI